MNEQFLILNNVQFNKALKMHTAKSANKNQVDYVVRRKFFWNRTFSFIENPTYPSKSPERIAHREKGFNRLTQLDIY